MTRVQGDDCVLERIKKLAGVLVADLTGDEALHDFRDGDLDSVAIIERHGFKPALAGALGLHPGAADLVALMRVAIAHPAQRRTLAACAVLFDMAAGRAGRFHCLGHGFGRPLPPGFAKSCESST